MKNLLFGAIMLMGTFVFANSGNLNDDNSEYSYKIESIEYTYIKGEDDITRCYARFCWNESETRRKCTEWQEIPCETTIELETASDEPNHNQQA